MIEIYYIPYYYQHPHYMNSPAYVYGVPQAYEPFQRQQMQRNSLDDNPITLTDYGPNPFVIDIDDAAKQNNNFRTTLWTGPHLQVTLMSIPVGEDVGLEIHPEDDQFLKIEEGQAMVQMGQSKEQLNFVRYVEDDSAIIVPANTWHNIINTGTEPLKLYSIYAPPHHPFGTVHRTKAEAMEEEH